MLNRNSNFQKQVLWWWICLLDSSGGAFHQVWSPCSWWELRKRKVKPKIITTYDSVSVTSFQCNHLLPRDWNVDLIPKFLMANGQLVKLLVHTGVPLTHHANSRNIHKVSISHYIIYNQNNRLLVIGNSGQIIQREKGKKEQINTRVNKKLRKICQKELNQRITEKNVGVLVLHDWLEHMRIILYTEHNWNNVVKLATRTVKEPRITKMCFGGQNLKCPRAENPFPLHGLQFMI